LLFELTVLCVYCVVVVLVKPLYGMMSDSVIFYGLQRAPYIGVAGGIGVLSLFALGFLSLPLLISALFIFGVNLSVASPDVMIDAIIAQQCKYYPKFSSDLQSLCWGSYAVFSVIGYGVSGVAIQVAGPRGTFLIVMITAAAVFLPTLLGFVGEKRLNQQLAAAIALEESSARLGAGGNRISQQSVRVRGFGGDEETGGGGGGGAAGDGDGGEEVAAVKSPLQSGGEDATGATASARARARDTSDHQVKGEVAGELKAGGEDSDTCIDNPNGDRGSEQLSARMSRKCAVPASSSSSFLQLDLTLYRTHRSVFYLGLWVPFCAVLLALIVFVIQEWVVRFAAVTLVALLVAGSVYVVNYKKMPLLANVALFIFLRQVLTPDIETVMFYW
jgi:hypothetical protein